VSVDAHVIVAARVIRERPRGRDRSPVDDLVSCFSSGALAALSTGRLTSTVSFPFTLAATITVQSTSHVYVDGGR
jgi:hypothetical protein